VLIVLVVVGTAWLMDGLVRPRTARSMRQAMGLWLQALMVVTLHGALLALAGNPWVAAALTIALLALFAVVSNAKHAMLGEPLVFTDLALIGAVFRHPQFYLSAVSLWQRALGALAGLVLLGVLGALFDPSPARHAAGAIWAGVGLTMLWLSLRIAGIARLAPHPDLAGDVRRLGLLPVLLLYWLRWRASADPAPCPPATVARDGAADADAPALAVVIQCESFADPVELFGDDALALPALTQARADAWQWGDLAVSGFGAYTMRTEYGVVFGRSEEALGFRLFDPFLSALGEGSYGLGSRLDGAGWRSLFLHPHDMRFYGRDRIMPAAGFAELVGEDRFTPPAPHEGRYVTDDAMAQTIATLAQDAASDAANGDSPPTLLYAVTIENHGPWAPAEETDDTVPKGDLKASYVRLVRRSDAMLARLRRDLAALGRPSLLVFFGDHRPSIPAVTRPGGDRHTPYVMLRLDAQGRPIAGPGAHGPGRVDLTPAELHAAIMTALAPPAQA